MIKITEKPIDVTVIFDYLQKDHSGSVVIHDAVVKRMEAGKPTSGIQFERAGDVEEELSSVEKSLRQSWPVEDVVLIRRIGKLSPGDVISVAATSSEHRDAAFRVCQEAIERFKKMKTLAKKELFHD